MINLRYHIVSITAVFLALAIGVAMGTSFLSKATVDQLKNQIGRAEARINNSDKENARLTGELKRLDDASKALRQDGQQLLEGRLNGQTVLVIASAGVDRDSLASVQTALGIAGADYRGTLVVNQKLRLDGDDATKMAELLGITSTARSTVRRTLASRFARILMEASVPDAGTEDRGPGGGTASTTSSTVATTAPEQTFPPATTAPGAGTTTTTRPVPHVEPPLLTDLRAGGWLSYLPPSGGSGDDPLLTTRGYRYLVVSGSGAVVPDTRFLFPVLRDMAEAGPAPAVVASAAVGPDPETTRPLVVAPIRQDDVMRKNLSTVDDLETFNGLAAVVLALEQLDSIHGHYGVGPGATSLLPPAL